MCYEIYSYLRLIFGLSSAKRLRGYILVFGRHDAGSPAGATGGIHSPPGRREIVIIAPQVVLHFYTFTKIFKSIGYAPQVVGLLRSTLQGGGKMQALPQGPPEVYIPRRVGVRQSL